MLQTGVVEKIKKHTFRTVIVFLNHATYAIWKNYVEPDGPQMTIRRMHMACWKTKATDTCSLYVTLTASPLQQRFYECASELHYMYSAVKF